MRINPTHIFVVSVALGWAVVGCKDDRRPSFIYDTCFTVDNCVSEAELCEEITTNIAGELYVNAICTVSCATLGAASPDCPLPFIANLGRGSCYVGTDAGGTSMTPVCFEPCAETGDCLFGFVCLNDEQICGASTSCPIEAGDSICVPGP